MEPQVEPMTPLEKVQWMLDQHGWGVEPVPAAHEPPPPRPGYSYTFGLEALVGHPEIVIFGLAPVAARGLLGLAVDHLRLGGHIPEGEPFVGLLAGSLRAVLVPVERAQHQGLFPTLPLIYGDQPWRVTQFVWPDRNGSLPWEEGWPEQLRLVQPVLGRNGPDLALSDR